jgi:hypothetical protein
VAALFGDTHRTRAHLHVRGVSLASPARRRLLLLAVGADGNLIGAGQLPSIDLHQTYATQPVGDGLGF